MQIVTTEHIYWFCIGFTFKRILFWCIVPIHLIRIIYHEVHEWRTKCWWHGKTGEMQVWQRVYRRGCHGVDRFWSISTHHLFRRWHNNSMSFSFWLLLQRILEHTLPYIYSIVIFHICMSLFESTLLSFCKPQTKLDLPTLRQGGWERMNATEQIKNKALARIRTQVLG